MDREQTPERLGLTLLGLAALLALVALASGHPIGAHVTGIGHRPIGAAASALIGLAGSAALLVAALLAAIFRGSFRRRRDPEEPVHDTPPLARPWVLPLVIAAVALSLGTVLGIGLLRHAHVAARLILPAGRAGSSAAPLPPASPHAGGLSPALIALAATMVGVIVLGWLLIATADRRRRTGEPFAERQAIREALSAAEADLDWSLDPRIAVLRAYARMEAVLGGHGLTRRRSEAPREYLARSLATIAGASPGIERLTDRFEEARYSTHTIEEAARDDARDALRDLRAQLTPRPQKAQSG